MKLAIYCLTLPTILAFTYPQANAKAKQSDNKAASCDLRLVSGSGLNLRTTADKNSPIISTLPLNSRVCFEDRLHEWVFISTELDRDLKGWAQERFLSKEATNANEASNLAEKYFKVKDYIAAVKWAERAAEANETTNNLKFLLKLYIELGNQKKITSTEQRIANLQLTNVSSLEDVTQASSVSTVSAVLLPNSPLWNKLNCDHQIKNKQQLSQPFTALHFPGSGDFEFLYPTNSPLSDQLRTLHQALELINNHDIEDCVVADVPAIGRCDSFEEAFPALQKHAAESLTHNALTPLKGILTSLEQKKVTEGKNFVRWWSTTKKDFVTSLPMLLTTLATEAKGVFAPNYNISSTTEWDHYWLQKNVFSSIATESSAYNENLKFAACNYFDHTYVSAKKTDHILGLESLLNLAEKMIEKKQTDSALEILNLIIADYPTPGWVENNGHFGGTYASQAEKLKLILTCKKNGKQSPTFASVDSFSIALKTALKNQAPEQWSALFSCHVLTLHSIDNQYTEQITQSSALKILSDARDEILKPTKPISPLMLKQRSNTLSFSHIQFVLDPHGRWVQISK